MSNRGMGQDKGVRALLHPGARGRTVRTVPGTQVYQYYLHPVELGMARSSSMLRPASVAQWLESKVRSAPTHCFQREP